MRFLAYRLAIFTEYTAWATFGEESRSALEIIDFFVISQSKQICKWGIKYGHLVTTDHVGSTCAHHYSQIASFITVAHTELWIFDLFVISQFEQICKWGIKYVHSETTDQYLCPPTHIPSLTKIVHCVLIREWRFTFWCWRETYICSHIHTDRQCYKWKLSGPSSIAGGPQLCLNFVPLWEWMWHQNSTCTCQPFNGTSFVLHAYFSANWWHHTFLVLPNIQHTVTSRPISKWDQV